jgi:hypothetical protein
MMFAWYGKEKKSDRNLWGLGDARDDSVVHDVNIAFFHHQRGHPTSRTGGIRHATTAPEAAEATCKTEHGSTKAEACHSAYVDDWGAHERCRGAGCRKAAVAQYRFTLWCHDIGHDIRRGKIR